MDTVWTGLIAGIVAFVATLLTQFLTQRHQKNLLNRELEYQTRAALRQTYDRLLVAQRRSREASLRLAEARQIAKSAKKRLEAEATQTHTVFIEHYHQLNLDASPEMWVEARTLRHVLDGLLKAARKGHATKAADLAEDARNARQNLERSFRTRLGYDALQCRQPIAAKYDKLPDLALFLEKSEAAKRARSRRARLRAWIRR